MPIVYASDKITVTYTGGDPKGDSFLNPWTPEDIYQADLTGGWGIVTRVASGNYATYYIIKRVEIWNVATFFDMSQTNMIIYDPAQISSYPVCSITANFLAENCMLSFAAESSTQGQRVSIQAVTGVVITFKQFSLEIVETWSVVANGGILSFQDCIFVKIRNHYHQGTTLDNVSIHGGSYGMIPQVAFSSAVRVQVREAVR